MNRKKVDANDTSKTAKHRVSTIGAGTSAMVICLLFLLGYQLTDKPKVEIERRVSASGEAKQTRLPTVRTILGSKVELELSETQINDLQKLKEEETKALSPIESRLNEIMSHPQMPYSSGNTHSLTVNEIRELSEKIAPPSKEKRTIARRFSERALKLLTPKQQRKADQLSFSRVTIVNSKGEKQQ